MGAHSGAADSDTTRQDGRSWVPFPMVSLDLFIDIILPTGPGVNSISNRNKYQEYFLKGKGSRCIGLTTLPPSCAEHLEVTEPQPPGTLWACNRPEQGLLYLLPLATVNTAHTSAQSE